MVSSDRQVIGNLEVKRLYLIRFYYALLTILFELIDSGHEGPVSSLSFSPSLLSSMLVSVSWDKTLRVWDAVATAASLTREAINLTADGLAVAFRPDGERVAVATLDGHIAIFNPHQVNSRNFY